MNSNKRDNPKYSLGPVRKQTMVDAEFFAVFSEMFSAVMRMSNKNTAVTISSDLLERAKALNRRYAIGGINIVRSEPLPTPAPVAELPKEAEGKATSPKEVKSAEYILNEHLGGQNSRFEPFDTCYRKRVLAAMTEYASQLHPVSKSEGEIPNEHLIDSIENMKINGIKGATYGDTEYDSPSVAYGYNSAIDNVIALVVKNSAPVSKDALTEAVEPTASDITSLFKNQKQ